MATPYEVPSVLDEVREGEWSTERAGAYEAAVEAINHAVGAYSALIESAKSSGADAARVRELIEGRKNCARDRELLKPEDAEAVAEARRRYTALVRRLKDMDA
jgi:hypothetical protein